MLNIWIKLLIAGLIIAPAGGFTSLVIGWSSNIDALLWVSVAFSAIGGVLFWVGLVGFLVTKFRESPARAE